MSDPLDPKHNHVTFKFNVDGAVHELHGIGPAQAVDCVAALWQSLSEGSGRAASEVVEIYTEWEPSAEDLAFLDDTFPPDAQLAYTFRRPAVGGWPAALSAAAKVINGPGQRLGKGGKTAGNPGKSAGKTRSARPGKPGSARPRKSSGKSSPRR